MLKMLQAIICQLFHILTRKSLFILPFLLVIENLGIDRKEDTNFRPIEETACMEGMLVNVDNLKIVRTMPGTIKSVLATDKKLVFKLRQANSKTYVTTCRINLKTECTSSSPHRDCTCRINGSKVSILYRFAVNATLSEGVVRCHWNHTNTDIPIPKVYHPTSKEVAVLQARRLSSYSSTSCYFPIEQDRRVTYCCVDMAQPCIPYIEHGGRTFSRNDPCAVYMLPENIFDPLPFTFKHTVCGQEGVTFSCTGEMGGDRQNTDFTHILETQCGEGMLAGFDYLKIERKLPGTERDIFGSPRVDYYLRLADTDTFYLSCSVNVTRPCIRRQSGCHCIRDGSGISVVYRMKLNESYSEATVKCSWNGSHTLISVPKVYGKPQSNYSDPCYFPVSEDNEVTYCCNNTAKPCVVEIEHDGVRLSQNEPCAVMTLTHNASSTHWFGFHHTVCGQPTHFHCHARPADDGQTDEFYRVLETDCSEGILADIDHISIKRKLPGEQQEILNTLRVDYEMKLANSEKYYPSCSIDLQRPCVREGIGCFCTEDFDGGLRVTYRIRPSARFSEATMRCIWNDTFTDILFPKIYKLPTNEIGFLQDVKLTNDSSRPCYIPLNKERRITYCCTNTAKPCIVTVEYEGSTIKENETCAEFLHDYQTALKPFTFRHAVCGHVVGNFSCSVLAVEAENFAKVGEDSGQTTLFVALLTAGMFGGLGLVMMSVYWYMQFLQKDE